ncbi:MAG: GH1 family beta-glucosidase [Pseudomonadota bacterium]
MMKKRSRADFPAGFRFGAATAAYQIEGHAKGGAGPTHWDTWAAVPGNVVRAEDGARACDHYTRYEEDLDILRDGGFDAYRFSASWARVMPEGTGRVNAAGLDFYDRLADAILARGLEPHLTLYHWELPAALSDIGGWSHPDIARWFADFTEVIAGRIGDRMASIATLNEPWCVAWLGHFLGGHAPGHRDIRDAARAMHHVMKAHGAGLARLRQIGLDNLGIVLNFEHCTPATNAPADIAAAARHDAIYNRWFIEALTAGAYPAPVLDALAPHMPEGWQDDMAEISAPIDWLGINYYTRSLLSDAPEEAWPSYSGSRGPLPRTQMDWEIYPAGLTGFLTRLRDDHTGDLPLFVTENGMAWGDVIENGAVHDPERQSFIDLHLDAMEEAIAQGVNLQGFFYWSLLDNYEWAFGYEKRFGLVHVDFDTMARTPKGSYHALKSWLAETP